VVLLHTKSIYFMKELLQQFSAYHIWANNQLIQTLLLLSNEAQTREVRSSFNSVQKTILHQWDAESMWWQRMKLEEQVQRPGETFTGTFKQATEALQKQSLQWDAFLRAAQKHQLTHEFIYRNTKKEQFKQPVYQVLMHLFNHGTYHRGQLVTMLHQLGETKIPPTDFIVWSRKK